MGAPQRDLEADLRPANEFRSLFLTAIAHDIRTPLTAIIGFASLLDRDGVDDAARRSAAGQIASAAALLRDRVEELVAVAAIDFNGLRREPFDLLPIIRGAAGAATVEAPELPPVLGDAESARKVIENLVATTVRLARGSQVSIAARVQEDLVCVSISERKTTLGAEQAETLFERFFGLPGSPSSPESGVGLYVAKRLAEAQGGDLLVLPGDPAGVTFMFTLPLVSGFASPHSLR